MAYDRNDPRLSTTQDEPVVKGPWPKGMNNRLPDHAVLDDMLRNAVNVDIDSTGHVRRRLGYTKILGVVDGHSGFSCPLGTYFASGTNLYQLEDDDTATLLWQGLQGDRVTYEYFDGVVFFSDNIVTGKITVSGVSAWGLQVPNTPTLHRTSGAYGAGQYLAALVGVTASGQESGASEVVSIDVLDDSGFEFVDLPAVVDTQIKYLRLYLSTANGTVLYAVADVAVGTASYSVLSGSYDSGKPLDARYLVPPPPGRIVRFYRGRMYIADGSTIWYTEPYDLYRVNITKGFIQLPADVTVMEPVTNGIWVVADQTYFYEGKGPEDFSPRPELNYGAVFGTGLKIPHTNDVLWYSERGTIMGNQDGQAKNLQEDMVAVDSGVAGASIVIEQDGTRKFISVIQEPVASPLAARSFATMEITRRQGG